MATILRPPPATPVSPDVRRLPPLPGTLELTGTNHARQSAAPPDTMPAVTPLSHRAGVVGLLGLRLVVGFEFIWAFLDKTFGLGYATPSARAWIHGGSPTTGFLSGVKTGPFQSFMNGLAGVAAVDWLFMLGLLGIGTALILGVAIRPAAISATVLLLMMYGATWTNSTLAAGQPTHSTNPVIDAHITSIMAVIVLGAFAALSAGWFSRRWSALGLVRAHPWLR